MKFYVIEVCEVSCSCESCLYNEGKECPNKVYASEWKPINIATGKPVLQENFINEHWDPNAKNVNSNANSHTDSHADSHAESNFDDVPVTYQKYKEKEAMYSCQTKM